MELGWKGQRDWEEKFEKLQYQALKKFVNVTHGSKRELVSQIAGAESPKMALDITQARTIGKLRRDPLYMNELWKDDGSGRYIKKDRKSVV